jgi:hypothetical protein
MAYDAPPPENRPEPGFYCHFKHDPNGPVNNYAYYISGVGHHTWLPVPQSSEIWLWTPGQGARRRLLAIRW